MISDGMDFSIEKAYVWKPYNDKKSELSSYVRHFFNLKNNTSKDHPDYLFYKILLNSLYGKFQQLTPDHKGNLKTGNLFNPFISSQITGYVRSQIHRLEHKYNSIHSSTDSIKTLTKIPEEDLSPELGGLQLEVEGRCILIRSRLYLHYDLEGKIKKTGLHGFHGKVDDLERVWRENLNTYETIHMSKPIESLRQNIDPLVFSIKQMRVNFNKVGEKNQLLV